MDGWMLCVYVCEYTVLAVQGVRCFEGVHSLCIPMVSSIAQYAGTYSSSNGDGVQISLAGVSLLFII